MIVSINLPRQVLVEEIPGPDFTTYSKDPPSLEVSKQDQFDDDQPKKAESYDGSFAICLKAKAGSEQDQTGRGLACSAYAGNYWSITLRCDAPNTRTRRDDYDASLQTGLREYTGRQPTEKSRARDYLGYCPKGYPKFANSIVSVTRTEASAPMAAAPGDTFLNDIYPLCKSLYDTLELHPDKSPSGLIAITGATDSSKSLITRGLIFLFLEAAAERAFAKGIRRPHLVTFEDPIEEYFIKNSKGLVPETEQDLNALLTTLNLDYTPRQKGIDAGSLIGVIRDAKRQTPAVLFVGETRDPGDWKELLDFGASGHLVCTTSHSGSVVDAMTQILRSTNTKTASQRSEVARRIRGIVNVRSFTDVVTNQDGTTGSMRALLPAVWKSTPQSVNNLVADGLSSILPARGRETELGYYGRTYFARALTHDSVTTEKFKQIADRPALEHKLVRKAMEWDIGGF